MPTLKEIFNIPDDAERLSKLLEYAKSLRINVLRAKKEDGSFGEDELAILIFDVEQNRVQSKRLNVAFVVSGLIIMVFLLIGLYFAMQFFQLGSIEILPVE